MNISSLDDKSLLDKTRKQAGAEREATVKMLACLREVHKRRLFSTLKYSSMFDFCVRDLSWSEGQASRRISAARLVEAKPEVGVKIANGEMSLGVAADLARFFKNEKPDENKKDELIEKVSGKSQRESAFHPFRRGRKSPAAKKRVIDTNLANHQPTRLERERRTS